VELENNMKVPERREEEGGKIDFLLCFFVGVVRKYGAVGRNFQKCVEVISFGPHTSKLFFILCT